MDAKLKAMRSESKTMTPNIIIGKNGMTDQVLQNIKSELSKHKLVKIKILQSYMSDKDKSEVFRDLMSKIKAKIVNQIGFTITLTNR